MAWLVVLVAMGATIVALAPGLVVLACLKMTSRRSFRVLADVISASQVVLLVIWATGWAFMLC